MHNPSKIISFPPLYLLVKTHRLLLTEVCRGAIQNDADPMPYTAYKQAWKKKIEYF